MFIFLNRSNVFFFLSKQAQKYVLIVLFYVAPIFYTAVRFLPTATRVWFSSFSKSQATFKRCLFNFN
jgi:hypothetical protein